MDRPRHYKLIGRLPAPCGDLLDWARSMNDVDLHRVGYDEIGCVRISTVFLGLDHNHLGVGDPLLFETMIFDGGEDSYQTRCTTWDEAKEMHRVAVQHAKDLVLNADDLAGFWKVIRSHGTHDDMKRAAPDTD